MIFGSPIVFFLNPTLIYILNLFRPPDDIPKQLYNDAGELRNNAVNASGTGSTIINLNIGPPPACAPPAPPKKRSLHNSANDHEPHLNNS